jgi:GntR family transcriptional regulator/MocR family aminotransferase
MAWDQLHVEGYLFTKRGAGVFVAADIPDDYHQITYSNLTTPDPLSKPDIPLSHLSNSIKKIPHQHQINTGSFSPGVPALDSFPNNIWRRLWHKHLKTPHQQTISTNNSAGYLPLRQAITDHARYSRGIDCTPEQVIITNGAQQALELICKILLNKGDQAIIEDPGYSGITNLLHAFGATISPCPVDKKGLQIEKLTALTSEKTKLIYTTPNHQYPLGSLMPIAHRIHLLAWAKKQKMYVIEDDYDSEFHYAAKPLPSLKSMDTHQQVIYVGSFSKVLLPTIRLGYLIVPQHLADIFIKVKKLTAGNTAYTKQAVTAEFIEQGHFNRHLKRTRILYETRMNTLISACKANLSELFDIYSHGAGMHLALISKQPIDDRKLANKLKKQNIHCNALSEYYLLKPKYYGLILGFANTTEENIIKSVMKIQKNMLV